MNGFIRVALTLASGGLYGLCFPPHALPWIAWIALVPLLVALRGASVRVALGLGWLWSVLAAWSVGEWMPAAVETYYLQPRAVGYAVFLGVATAMVAPYGMAFCALYARLAQRPSPALPLAAAAAWTGSELLRGRLFTGTPFFIGNPWALFGYSQADALPLLQVADLGGIYAVGFVLAAANAGIAEAIALRTLALALARRARPLAAGALPAVLALAYGSFRLAGHPGVTPAGAPVVVAVVQGDVAVGSLWSPEKHGENLDIYLELTARALAPPPAALVVWPETATSFFLEREDGFRLRIAQVLSASGAELLLGSPRNARDGASGERFFNSVYALGPDGRLAARYDKQLLVPFAEYFPFGGVEFLRRRFARVREFAPGSASAALPTRAGPAGVLICNEAMLPEVARSRVAAGAAWLVSPSNDSWVPSADFAELQFDVVRVRAVEQRRWLVRASTSGPSAIVDPFGRVTARTQPFEPAFVTGEITPLSGRSPYAQLGDVFGFACVVVALALVVRGRGRA